MAFYYLLATNFKLLYRNWRAIFFNLALPVAEYVVISILHIGTILGGATGDNYAKFLLPGIITLSIIQTGVFNLSYWLIDLKEHGVLKRIAATPVSRYDLVASFIISRLSMMLVQTVLLLIIGFLFFGAQLTGSFLWILLFVIVGGIVFLEIGMLISSAAHSYDEAAPITTGLNLVFAFLGNIFFPTQMLPKALQDFGKILPVTYLSNGLRNNLSMPQAHRNFYSIVVLFIWMVILGIWCSYSFAKENK
jgi:ABC-2 type transport system permease protein